MKRRCATVWRDLAVTCKLSSARLAVRLRSGALLSSSPFKRLQDCKKLPTAAPGGFSLQCNLAQPGLVQFRRKQQVHVVGHEHIGMQRTAEAQGEFFQKMQIETVVIFDKETHRAVVAALYDVSEYA